jgi:hypothetical protein
MGWKPTTDKSTGAAGQEAAPSPPTRRRRRAAAPSTTPLVDAAMAASPRVSTGMKPPGGANPTQTGKQDDRVNRKVRLGKRWSEIYYAVKRGDYTWAEFTDGLDEEELARGQLRAEDGTFTGRPPSFVPREFLLACQREQKRRFEEMFGSEVLGLTKDFLDLCKDNSIPPKDRAKLLQYAMERVFGGIPKDVRLSQEQPYEQMIVNVVTDAGDTDMPDHLRRRYGAYAERQGEGSDMGEA